MYLNRRFVFASSVCSAEWSRRERPFFSVFGRVPMRNSSWCLSLCLVSIVFPSGWLSGQTSTESDAGVACPIGDSAFFMIDYPRAVVAYETVIRATPRDPEVLWRLARVYVCMGEVAAEDGRDELYLKAERYARRCIAADSSNVHGRTWLGAALGYRALYAPSGEQIRLSHEMVKEIDLALKLSPGNDIAYSIKGSFYRALGNIGWFKKQLATLFLGEVPPGGYPEAEDALKNAVRIAPGVMRHHYELAVLYLDMRRKDEARRILEGALALPIRTASDRPRAEKIRELLSLLGEKPGGDSD